MPSNFVTNICSRREVSVLLYLLVMTFVFPKIAIAESPSFDCDKAKKVDELTICSDQELSHLDNLINSAYAKLKSDIGATKAKSLAAPFLKKRRACGSDGDCIRNVQTTALNVFTSELSDDQSGRDNISVQNSHSNNGGNSSLTNTASIDAASFFSSIYSFLSQNHSIAGLCIMIALAFIWFVIDSLSAVCPKCGTRNSLSDAYNKEYVGSSLQSRTYTKTVEKRTAEGRLISRSEVPVTEQFTVEKWKYDLRCKHCGHVWSEIK